MVPHKAVTYRLQLLSMIEVRRYVTADGRDLVGEWLSGMKDLRARAKIAVRIDRLSAGNFGDSKPLRQGLNELRIYEGPGYRLYHAMVGRTCVLLLCGGDKRKQSADIHRVLAYLKDYKERTGT
jgi:putative addiction module killer protein